MRGAHGAGRGHRALPRPGAERPKQTANGNVCNPSGVPVGPGTGSGQSFPCFQQSCTNRTWLSRKNACLCSKPTPPVLQGHHRSMKWNPNRCLHVLPPASSSFPSTECSTELFPITPFPFKPPQPKAQTHLRENLACREKTQPLLAGSSHYHLVPGESQCLGSRSAAEPALPGMARRLPAPSPSHSNPWHTEVAPSLFGGGYFYMGSLGWSQPTCRSPDTGKYPCPGCPGTALHSPFHSQAVEWFLLR